MKLVFELLAVDARSSTPSASWITTLRHEVLSWATNSQEGHPELRGLLDTYCDDSVEDNAVVIPTFGKLGEVLTRLLGAIS